MNLLNLFFEKIFKAAKIRWLKVFRCRYFLVAHDRAKRSQFVQCIIRYGKVQCLFLFFPYCTPLSKVQGYPR